MVGCSYGSGGAEGALARQLHLHRLHSRHAGLPARGRDSRCTRGDARHVADTNEINSAFPSTQLTPIRSRKRVSLAVFAEPVHALACIFCRYAQTDVFFGPVMEQASNGTYESRCSDSRVDCVALGLLLGGSWWEELRLASCVDMCNGHMRSSGFR
jgi:hypothetical protein